MPNHESQSDANKMWGGRITQASDDLMLAINSSIDFDQILAFEDIQGSLAHANMLCAQGIISQDDQAAIADGLLQIAEDIRQGEFPFSQELEDIHLNIENRLTQLIGEAGGRLHTARSRNDQVALDLRMWVRARMDQAMEELRVLMGALLDQAEAGKDIIMPGFTHLQSAQPVSWGHHMLAYVEMFGRDLSRFHDARIRMNECPLGAAALAGTSYPIDRHMTAEALGFDRPTANSMDSVSDRDFALEYLSTAALSAMHLSRLSEELVIWSSAQFRFVKISDKFSTGSSIMPQKRNPDAAELIRAKIGRINAAHQSLLMVMKGLPLTYSKDMQEDKEPVFDAARNYSIALRAMAAMLAETTPQRENLYKAAAADFSTATDLADWLVKTLALPFREAHHVTSRIVALADEQNCDLAHLDLSAMQSVHKDITDAVYDVLTVENSVNSRTSYGGTSIQNVQGEIEKWRAKL